MSLMIVPPSTGMFGRACGSLSNAPLAPKPAQLAQEVGALKSVLADKLGTVYSSLNGGFPIVKNHLCVPPGWMSTSRCCCCIPATDRKMSI